MTDEDIQAVYDFENAFNTAISTVLSDAETGGVTVRIPSDKRNFQQVRPRVEVAFKAGSANPKGSGGQRILVGGIARDVAYKGSFAIIAIASSQEQSQQVIAQYLCKMRYLMPLFPSLCNGKLLLNHNINFITETGTVPTYKPEEGIWESGITFDIDFSINVSALKFLN